MAVTNNGTKVSAPSEQLPPTYSRPSITEFSDWTWQRTVQLDVAKATVENATANTTMGNIISNGTIGVTKQVTDIVTDQFSSSKTVTCFADIIKIESNEPPQQTGNFFKNAAAKYVVTAIIYVKAA